MPLVDGLEAHCLSRILFGSLSHHLVMLILLERLLIFIRFPNDLFFLLSQIVV